MKFVIEPASMLAWSMAGAVALTVLLAGYGAGHLLGCWA